MNLARTLRRLQKRAFTAGLALNARLTRSPLRALEGRATTPFFCWLTLRVRGQRAVAREAAALGAEWERLIGSPAAARVVRHDAATAYGEIHAHCPLRGTGDVGACHRLMAYDRRLLAQAGGQLVVLASQAEPGRTHCEVAIRPSGAPVDDLVPAHLRVVRR